MRSAEVPLRQLVADLRTKAEAGHWEGLDEFAGEFDRRIREAFADPDPDTVAYLQTIREDHEKLTDHLVSMRDQIREQLKAVSKGRKAVAAYR